MPALKIDKAVILRGQPTSIMEASRETDPIVKLEIKDAGSFKYLVLSSRFQKNPKRLRRNIGRMIRRGQTPKSKYR